MLHTEAEPRCFLAVAASLSCVWWFSVRVAETLVVSAPRTANTK